MRLPFTTAATTLKGYTMTIMGAVVFFLDGLAIGVLLAQYLVRREHHKC